MAGNIKGITIEIGGETTKFQKAMKGMASVTKTTQRELDAVNKQLKFDPKNVDLLKQKEELLAKQIEQVKNKIDKMKAAKEQADRDMANGTEVNQEQYRQLVREISAAEKHLESLTRQSDKFASAGKKIEDVGNKMQSIGKKGMAVSGAIVGIGVATVGAMSAAAESTREYREDMNKLETAFKTGGFSVDAAKKSYEDFFVLLGETDRSVEAVNHLARFVKTEQDLAKWSDIAAGVTATFGDSLPIEGLTEAANETAKVAKVTGPLADALNWAGISEDEFNKKLEKTNSEQERAQLITETLHGTYKESAAIYKDLNKEIIANRKATSEANDQMAKLGATVEPVNQKLMEAKNKITTALLPTVGNLADKISGLNDEQLKLVAGTGAALLAVPSVVTGIGTVVTGIGKITGALGGVSAFMAAHPVGVAVAGIGLLIGGMAALDAAIVTDAEKRMAAHQDFMQQHEQRMEAFENQKQASEESAMASYSELEHVRGLKDELVLLADENGRVAEKDRARAEFILGELNGALGTEYAMTDGLIGKYGELTQSVDDLIVKKQAEAILAAQEGPYRTAIQNIEAQKKAVDEAKEKYGEAAQKYQDLLTAHEGEPAWSWDIAYARDEMELYGKELDSVKLEYQEFVDTINNYQINAGKVAEAPQTFVEEWRTAAGLTETVGQEAGQNFAKGIEGKSVDVKNSVLYIGDTTISGLEEGTAGANAVGRDVINGVISGMQSRNGALQAQALQMANQVIATFKSAQGFDINSPAKKTIPIGQSIMEGMGVGIKKDMTAEEALEKKISNLKNILSDYQKSADIDIKLAESEYDLWLLENFGASGDEKTAKAKELLNKKISAQEEKINNLNEAIYHQIELTGENSAEVNEYAAQLNNAKTELIELQRAASMAQVNLRFSETDSRLAEAEYEWWESENLDASKEEKRIKQKEMMNTVLANQEKNVQDLNDKLYIQNQLTGEESEESKKLLILLREAQKEYNETAKAVNELNLAKRYSAENVNLAQSEYDLWLAENSDATETEKLIKQKDLLNVKYDEQSNCIQDLEEQYRAQVEATGEASDESKKLLAELNKEREAYAKLAVEIENVNKAMDNADRTSYLAYSSYMHNYSASLLAQGVSAADIEASARKSSGYIGGRAITIQNNISGTTPDTAYKVSKETEKTVNNLAMQGVL